MRKLSALVLLALVTGCSVEGQATAVPVCGSDQIQLEAVVLDLRIATTALGAGSIVEALGAGSALVASDLGSETQAPVINPGHQIDIERLIALRPDIVFVDQDEPDETAIAAMLSVGAEVVELPPVSSMAESALRTIQIAEALGFPDRADELNQRVRGAIDAIDSEVLDGKSIAFLYLRGGAGVYLLGGEGSGADDLILSLGAVDVGTTIGIAGFAPINPESLLAANPDFIMVMQKGVESVGGISGLTQLPGVNGTSAASNQAYLVGNDSQLLSFGPGTPTVLACLVEQVAN